MEIAALNPAPTQPSETRAENYPDTFDSNRGGQVSHGKPKYSFQESGYSYKRESFNMKMSNGDGDYFELSMDYQEFNAYTVESSRGMPISSSLRDILDNVENFIQEQYKKLLAYLRGEEVEWNATRLNAFKGNKTEGGLQIPEYWNAENTSTRIAEFALSFYAISGQDPGAFGERIKEAIEKGYDQAMDILGELPEKVAGLLRETRDLALEKIDNWVSENTQPALAAA